MLLLTRTLAAAFCLLFGAAGRADAAENAAVHQTVSIPEAPNPNAPPQLAQFAFLIGVWRCEAKLKSPIGIWQSFKAVWSGRFILDGYAIADEYRMMDAAGDTVVLGLNLRTYNAAGHGWNIKWLNALSGTWTDLAPSELGGVSIHGPSITYAFREPSGAHAYTRATYTNSSKTQFTWRGEKSDDGKTWGEFMVVACTRGEG